MTFPGSALLYGTRKIFNVLVLNIVRRNVDPGNLTVFHMFVNVQLSLSSHLYGEELYKPMCFRSNPLPTLIIVLFCNCCCTLIEGNKYV